MFHLSHSMNNRNNRNEKTSTKKKDSDTDSDSSSAYSTTSLSQISIDSLELDSDSQSVEEDNEAYVKHENLLSVEELNNIRNELSLNSRTVQLQYETYFVDNKQVDYEKQNQISVFLNDPGHNETNNTSLLKEVAVTNTAVTNNSNLKASRPFHRTKYYTSLELSTNNNNSNYGTTSSSIPTYSFPSSEINSNTSSYSFRHFNDWKSHLIYFKLIKGYAHNQHIVRKCCRAHKHTAHTIMGENAKNENKMNQLFYSENATVYENPTVKADNGDFTTTTTTSATNPYTNQLSSRSELNELSQRAIEFSSKMSNLERILNSTQLGPNNLTIGPINNYSKIKDNSHLHHMYNAAANSNLEASLNEAYVNSKKLKNSDFHKFSEHYKIEQNVRKLINDSLSSAQHKLPDLRNQIRSQLNKDNGDKSEPNTSCQNHPSNTSPKLEKQLPQQNIRFNSKQIKQFNSNTLHFTPNMIAGILGPGPITTKPVNPVGSLLHDVLTKANDSFFMPNVEKENERNIRHLSSAQRVKTKKRVIAFYHRVNENEYNNNGNNNNAKVASRIRPK